MSDTFQRILTLVLNGEVRVSEHGYDELVEDRIGVRELLDGISSAVLVEDYPNYGKGPCVLLLQRGHADLPIHVVWGIPKGETSPAILVTAYRPDTGRWENDFIRRKK